MIDGCVLGFTGNIIKYKITNGVANNLKIVSIMMKDLKGKIYADKGYISRKEFLRLLEQGLILVTGIKKNMKDRLLELWDKVLLKKKIFDLFCLQYFEKYIAFRTLQT